MASVYYRGVHRYEISLDSLEIIRIHNFVDRNENFARGIQELIMRRIPISTHWFLDQWILARKSSTIQGLLIHNIHSILKANIGYSKSHSTMLSGKLLQDDEWDGRDCVPDQKKPVWNIMILNEVFYKTLLSLGRRLKGKKANPYSLLVVTKFYSFHCTMVQCSQSVPVCFMSNLRE